MAGITQKNQKSYISIAVPFASDIFLTLAGASCSYSGLHYGPHP